MRIYIPTQLGDISLAPKDKQTLLTFESLTEPEKGKLEQFLKSYHLRLDAALSKAEIILPGNFTQVHKSFLRVFKGGKKVINAVRLKDGKVEVVQEFPVKDFEAGVSVEKPHRGCPLPTLLERAEIRAQEVLHEFLSRQQWRDFEEYGSFVARGNWSGDPYLITSRWNPSCQQLGVLYCIPSGMRICASLDDIPPAEELLAMKLAVEFMEKAFLASEDIAY